MKAKPFLQAGCILLLTLGLFQAWLAVPGVRAKLTSTHGIYLPLVLKPGATATPAGTPQPTRSPSHTYTASQTASSTPTGTSTPSQTASHTPTETFTPSQTASNTPIITNTPSQTASNTPTITSTPTQTASNTPTITSTHTQTASNTPTGTSTPTQTPSHTPSNTSTPTQTASNTPTNTSTPTQTATPTISLPLIEGFEGGVVPPPGWSEVETNHSYNWEIAEAGVPHGGDYLANVDYDNRPQDEWLLSPTLSLSEATLSFWSFGSTYWCRDIYDYCDLKLWIVVGAPGGTDDIYLGKADPAWSASWTWAYSSFDLTPFLPGGPVRIGFEYLGQDGAQIALDDIRLDGAP